MQQPCGLDNRLCLAHSPSSYGFRFVVVRVAVVVDATDAPSLGPGESVDHAGP